MSRGRRKGEDFGFRGKQNFWGWGSGNSHVSKSILKVQGIQEFKIEILSSSPNIPNPEKTSRGTRTMDEDYRNWTKNLLGLPCFLF
jgi:hypothetical protein